MTLSPVQMIIMILMVAVGAFFTRSAPFILFPESKNPPKIVNYLSTMLPAAMMGLLVVYCLKGVSVFAYPYGLPELIAIAAITALHLWKGNVLLSIGAGTAIYMLLVQFVF